MQVVMSVADIRSQSEEREPHRLTTVSHAGSQVSCGYTLSIRRAEPHRLTTVSHAGSHVSCGYTLSIRRAEPHHLTTVSHAESHVRLRIYALNPKSGASPPNYSQSCR